MPDRATAASYTASTATALFSAVTWQAIGVIAGIAIAYATYRTNKYFRQKDEERKAEKHAAEMAALMAKAED